MKTIWPVNFQLGIMVKHLERMLMIYVKLEGNDQMNHKSSSKLKLGEPVLIPHNLFDQQTKYVLDTKVQPIKAHLMI